MTSDRARLVAWVASAQNLAAVTAVAFVLTAFAAAELMKAETLHISMPDAFADPSGLSIVGTPTQAPELTVLYPSVGSGTIGPRSGS